MIKILQIQLPQVKICFKTNASDIKRWHKQVDSINGMGFFLLQDLS